MSGNLESLVYSKSVVEFVAVAKEFCAYIENANRIGRKQFVEVSSKLLAMLYYKAAMLPQTEPLHEEGNQKYVSEEMYENIRLSLVNLLGPYDDFPEVFDPRLAETDEQFKATISEYLADVYQDLKDFTAIYQEGVPEEMNEALWECKLNFDEFWGIRLANAIRAIHMLAYSKEPLEEPSDSEYPQDTDSEQRDTSNWFITKRQNDLLN